MKILKQLTFMCYGFLTIGFAQAQESITVTGTVTESATGDPIPGAAIVVKNQALGTTTDFDGNYTLETTSNAVLIYSFIGYTKKEISVNGQTTINVSLDVSNQQLDEIIVTGVFDERTRMESSVAISTMGIKEIARVAPTSSADLLKNMPGIYVNQARGEVWNTVYSRGISAGSNDNANGYYYVSLQEDGLPVTNLNRNVDGFLRADIGTAKVEAVRGGTASIFGANAPGGIFNYVSREGGSEFEGEIRAKFGMEGNVKNPYYRADVNVGGPLSKDGSWTYNLSGFYRRSDGARYPGYPMNEGGQFRANLVKKYNTGKIKFYAKILDDKNALGEFTPTSNWADPSIVDGFTATDSYYLPSLSLDIPINDTGIFHFNSEDKLHHQQQAFGLNWEQDLGNGFKIKNDARYQTMQKADNIPAVVTPFATDSFLFYAIPHLLGKTGTYTFTDMVTGNVLGTTVQAFDFTVPFGPPFSFTAGANNNFPGSNVQPNSLFFLPLFGSASTETSEFMDNFTISKKFENMNLMAGAFYARSTSDDVGIGQDYGIAVGTMQDQPHLVDITLAGQDGNTYQVTDPNGVMDVGRGGVNLASFTKEQVSWFLAWEWKVNDKLNLDVGFRHENIKINGFNSQAIINEESAGRDGDPLTLYDNYGGTEGPELDIDQTVSTASFSSGLNYKFTDEQAFYVRYSYGKKAPDINFYLVQTSQYLIDNTIPYSQQVEQLEAGYKLSTNKAKLYITPFYSVLSNIPVTQVFLDVDGTNYNAPVQFNKYKTRGVELDGSYAFTHEILLKAGATFQSSKLTKFTSWVAGNDGPADDVLLDLSGNETENTPTVMFNINPMYNGDKVFGAINVSYMGERQANNQNAWQMPAFTTVDLTLGYDFSEKFSLQANMNNVFNTYGIMGWFGTGGFPAALNRDGVTSAFVAANPTAPFSSQGNMPRSLFLTATYRF
ncbi:TonB-dependent receptor [Allomuricauda sp. NBRC 101325]|uniref:TonB-dependent receptor n=1 Tax=Allomuricauda sp. NBRC 101325 TaxID=1113758 RepID=UPI0024A4E4F2|nr:TonB-dependent receptor [Muricauda sp. NBRC 101325]GLU45188.1 TonB-dependent receptor [Muricauda sp. NBRC 101325]